MNLKWLCRCFHTEKFVRIQKLSSDTEIILSNFFNAILHRLLDDFKSHLDLCVSSDSAVTVCQKVSDVIGFVHLVYCYFMSLTVEPFSFQNRLSQLIVKHMSLFFRECATAVQLAIASSSDKTKVENVVSIIYLFGKLWYQSILYLTSFAHDVDAADMLVAPCVDLLKVLLVFSNIPNESSQNLIKACMKQREDAGIAGFPYMLGPVDDLPDQATWGTAYALMDYPATMALSDGEILQLYMQDLALCRKEIVQNACMLEYLKK